VATPALTTDAVAIRSQLERILESHGFRTSKRYPNLLKHLVERTLEGRTAELKERALGVEVFGRPADYDTNADPVVRVTAGEIRKRIAQYYHEAGHEAEVRIDLPLGSYVPEFHVPAERLAIVEPPPPVVAPRKRRRYLPLIAVVIPLAAVGIWWSLSTRQGVYDQFWRPWLGQGTVSVCVARSPGTTGTPSDDRPKVVAWADVVTASRITGMLEAKRQAYQVRLDVRATMGDLRQGPAVMIGAFNDVWTLRVTDDLRFGFDRQGALCWIRDRENPTSREWAVDLSNVDAAGHVTLKRDYAVISRILQSRTGKPAVTVAGVWGYATEAAGELVTDRAALESLAPKLPANWAKKNMQIVMGMEVMDDHPGPPRLLVAHVW
jgi:hypothetical protein